MKIRSLLALICLSLLTPSLFAQTNAPADSTNAVTPPPAAPAATTNTISPFQQAVLAYQKTNQYADAETVARLSATMDALPPVSVEASNHFAAGQAMLNTTNSSQAWREFFAATTNAPWWAEAWYDFALSREMGGDYDNATYGLKVYQDFKLSADDIHKARDKAGAIAFESNVAAYQRPPNYFSYAAIVAKLTAGMDSVPPLSVEARRHFVMGQTIFKDAATTNDFQQAFTEFLLASTNSPWVANIWFNMAVAAESEGRYDLATNCLVVYQDFKLSADDAQKAQDKIYEIQARQEMQADKRAREQKAAVDAAAAEEKKKNLNGMKWRCDWIPTQYLEGYTEVICFENTLIATKYYTRDTWSAVSNVGRPYVSWKITFEGGLTGRTFSPIVDDCGNCGPYSIAIGEDGQTITLTCNGGQICASDEKLLVFTRE